MSVTIRQVCTDAAQEIGVASQGEALGASDAQVFLGLLHRLLNQWNGNRRAVYAAAFPEFTLVPNLSPHTIGPTGATWTTTQRPVSIDGANLVLNTVSPEVNTPINIRDAQWWRGQDVPGLTSTFPTDLYYQPDWPNGKLFFWPTPTAAYDVQLMIRVVLDDTVTLSQTFSLPPGYQQAITLSLAEMAQRPFAKPADGSLILDASRARALIFDNNDSAPLLLTHDPGMTPGKGGSRADFNWLTGAIV